MTRDFVNQKSLLDKKSKNQSNDKKNLVKKTPRLIIAGLFLISIGISLFLWFKPKLMEFWQKLNEPALYEIINPEIVDQQLLRITNNLHTTNDVLLGVEELTKPLKGSYGVYVESLKNGKSYGLNEKEEFIAASVNKIWTILMALKKADKGEFDLSDSYFLSAKDIQNYGTGSMRYAKIGTKYSYGQLIELAGKQSDNTANWILVVILGKDNLQNFVDGLGFKNTSIENNTTTPEDVGRVFTKIYKQEILSEKSREKFYSVLTNTAFENRLPKGVPDFVPVVHKIGNEINTINDCGIIFNKANPYVICILSKGVVEQEALEVLPKISHLVWVFESTKQ